MNIRLRLNTSTPSSQAERYARCKTLAAALRVPLRSAELLLLEATVLPAIFGDVEADELQRRLTDAGFHVERFTTGEGRLEACSAHPAFVEGGECGQCRASLCVVCLREGDGLCSACRGKHVRRKKWQRRRIAVLLLVLAVVLLLGLGEWHRRNLGWDRPQRVAVVLVMPNDAPAQDAIEAFVGGRASVEAALAAQKSRYGDDGEVPFEFQVFGPVAEQQPVPSFHEDDVWSLFQFNRQLGSYAKTHDDATSLDEALFDARIYLRVTQPDVETIQHVEGLSQDGGEIGVVTAELAAANWDFAWFVVVHELLHTRGATDKYGPSGLARAPEGLADPNREPRYPQTGIELMARGQPESETRELPPGAPQTWAVGAWTAAEIGWSDGAAQ